jgi:hypothetical protein
MMPVWERPDKNKDFDCKSLIEEPIKNVLCIAYIQGK